MKPLQRLGDWALDHPQAVLNGFASVGGATIGYRLGGLTGACAGALMGVLLVTFAISIDPIDPTLGPHK